MAVNSGRGSPLADPKTLPFLTRSLLVTTALAALIVIASFWLGWRKFSIYGVTKADEIAGSIDAAKASGVGALNVLAGTLLYNNRQVILPRVAKLGLPAIYQFPAAAEEGGFIAYGSSLEQIYQDILSRQLVKLLRGVKPADIPVEQPTKFELVVNLRLRRHSV